MNNGEILKKAKNFLIKECDHIAQNWNKMLIKKHEDLVDVSTNFDLEIEKSFSDFVKTNFPDHGFRGEEDKDLDRDGEYIWYIDPIDGTKYFANGIPFWSSTLALVKKGEAVLGVVYNPVTKELYSAIQGMGAFINDEMIHISSEKNLNKMQISIDLSNVEFEWGDLYEDTSTLFSKLHKQSYRIRMIGAGAISLSWLAKGFFGAHIDVARPENKEVDIAAGLLIAKEAGAEIFRKDIGHGLIRSVIADPDVIKTLKEII